MSSSRPASSPRGCSSISPSFLPGSFGTRSDPGSVPFVPASRHRSLSLQTRCARHFPNFSWLPPKTILSRNSSPIGKTTRIRGCSAWLHDQQGGTLENVEANLPTNGVPELAPEQVAALEKLAAGEGDPIALARILRPVAHFL